MGEYGYTKISSPGATLFSSAARTGSILNIATVPALVVVEWAVRARTRLNPAKRDSADGQNLQCQIGDLRPIAAEIVDAQDQQQRRPEDKMVDIPAVKLREPQRPCA